MKLQGQGLKYLVQLLGHLVLFLLLQDLLVPQVLGLLLQQHPLHVVHDVGALASQGLVLNCEEVASDLESHSFRSTRVDGRQATVVQNIWNNTTMMLSRGLSLQVEGGY